MFSSTEQKAIPKDMEKNIKRDAIGAATVIRTAEITGVSERYVRYVLDGKRNNEEVLTVYMELMDGQNKLMQAVKQLVPFYGHRDQELEVNYRNYGTGQ